MKTITLRQEVKNELDKYADGRSVNKAVRMLLENAEEQEIMGRCDKKGKFYNIKVDDDLLDKLKRCKKYSNESHSDTIKRLLSECQSKH